MSEHVHPKVLVETECLAEHFDGIALATLASTTSVKPRKPQSTVPGSTSA